jgi:L-amino acid N-acyltransferase YncA
MLHPDVLQRRVVGKRLLQEAIAHGPQLRIRSLVGLIFDHDEPSIALFRAAGFERWGLLPGVARIDQTPRDLTIFGRNV